MQPLREIFEHRSGLEPAGLRRGHRAAQNRGRRLHKGGVDLIAHRGFGLAGNLGGNGVFLLIFVIIQLRVFRLAREKAHRVERKALRHDDCGIVVAGIEALERLIRVGEENPAHGGVSLQRGDDLIAEVDAHAHELHALIGIDHRDADAARGLRLIGGPVGKDIEPRIQARDNAQAEQRHDGDDRGRDTAQIAAPDADNLFHGVFSSLAPARCSSRRSTAPCGSSGSSSSNAASRRVTSLSVFKISWSAYSIMMR